jgi:hypothetical protein
MSIPSPNVAVYTENLVVTPGSKAALLAWVNTLPDGPQKTRLLNDLANANFASDIAVAGFNTIIVGLFHVYEDGSLGYNDFPLQPETYFAICDGIAALKTSPGSTVETMTVSFGGGGSPSVSNSDYPRMKAKWDVFKPLLLGLMKKINADGVDWDYEPTWPPDAPPTFDANFIIKITNEIAAESFLITAAPYINISYWRQVIQGTVKPGGTGNNFAWWNLQTYGGAAYGEWVSALQNISGMSGDQIQTFVVPGYAPNQCDPSYMVGDLTGNLGTYPHLDGAFIWNYTGIKPCASKMAAAIRGVFAG